MLASAAQSAAVLQVSAVCEVTSATVPAVPPRLIAPVASGAGRAAVAPAPAASPIRYVAPGAMVPDRFVTCHVVAAPGAAEMYWTDHEASDTGAEPLLRNSMKSFLSVAPELPPPP